MSYLVFHDEGYHHQACRSDLAATSAGGSSDGAQRRRDHQGTVGESVRSWDAVRLCPVLRSSWKCIRQPKACNKRTSPVSTNVITICDTTLPSLSCAIYTGV